jgi:sugar phosphate isomerase/epimerase
VKDAEFNPTGKAGVYGGYLGWVDRPGRFRSLGDGQINFRAIFSRFAQYNYRGWAVLEWECCLKHPEQGAAEGAPFIADHMIRVTEKAFDDFAGAEPDADRNRRILGL